MTTYIVRRLLYMFPILIGVSLIVFILFNVVGGDPALQMAGKYATPEKLHEIRELYGLNDPLYVQYFRFLGEIATFDFSG